MVISWVVVSDSQAVYLITTDLSTLSFLLNEMTPRLLSTLAHSLVGWGLGV
jgi:hypothetical protein